MKFLITVRTEIEMDSDERKTINKSREKLSRKTTSEKERKKWEEKEARLLKKAVEKFKTKYPELEIVLISPVHPK